MQRFRVSIIVFFFFWTLSHNAQIPEYYSSINFKENKQVLKVQLSNLTFETHLSFVPYTSLDTDIWDILRISDDSGNNKDVLLLYGNDNNDEKSITDRTRDAFETCHKLECGGLWNREHVFAKSLANPSLSTSEPGPGTDAHNLRAVDAQMNSLKSNRLFADSVGDAKIVDEDYFYPGDEWKGDVARILMYMHIRYPSLCEAFNTVVADTYDQNNTMPNILLEWNAEDPVSDFEIRRNDIIYLYQGNRNPFIDNPYLASLIWGGPEAEDRWGEFSSERFYEKLEVYPTICSDEIFINNPSSEKYINFSISRIDGEILQRGKAIHSIPIKIDKPGPYVLNLGNNNEKRVRIFIR